VPVTSKGSDASPEAPPDPEAGGLAMDERGYWQRRVSRRTALRGAGIAMGGLVGAALVGCGGGDEDTTSTAPVQRPAEGVAVGVAPSDDGVRIRPGTYTDPVPPTPAEQDPLKNGRYGGTVLARYLDPPHMDFNRTLSCTVNSTMDFTKNKLTRAAFGPKADSNRVTIEPDLAQSWEVTPDSTQYTFHLHKGVKFHNVQPTFGREFTSEDVKLSVERYMKGGTQQDVWAVVASIETPDNYTVIFKLNQPLSDFPQNIAAWSHMDAKEMLADPDFLREHAVGTGPFLQAEWTKKERSVFTKNPEYFEKGLPFVDRVVTVVQNDTAVQRAGYQTDNFAYWGPRDEEDAQSMLRDVKDSVYYKRASVVGANTNGIHFQMKNPRLQDIRVRRAFSMAIDNEEWDAARFAGDAQGYSNSPIPWPYLYNERPTLKGNGQWYQYNPAEASKLLQAAGYSAQNRLSLDAPAWYLRAEYREILQPQLQKIAELDFKPREVDNPTAVTMLNDRNYEDTMNITWGPPVYSVDQAVFPWYYSKGGLNHNNVNDAEMDRLVVAQRKEQKLEAKKELWLQIEARIYDQVWNRFFPTSGIARTFWHNYVINVRPHGISGTLSCYGDGKARALWLDKGAPSAAQLPVTFDGDGNIL
jgi:ABC-type transport system substrate-binding protein